MNLKKSHQQSSSLKANLKTEVLRAGLKSSRVPHLRIITGMAFHTVHVGTVAAKHLSPDDRGILQRKSGENQ